MFPLQILKSNYLPPNHPETARQIDHELVRTNPSTISLVKMLWSGPYMKRRFLVRVKLGGWWRGGPDRKSVSETAGTGL